MSQLALRFLRTATQIQGQVDARLAAHDLSLQQLKVLFILQKCDGRVAQVSHIKSQMIDPNSNVSRLLNKLMDKKLIEKTRDEEDQRVVHIKLLEQGSSALRIGKSIVDEEFQIFDNLSKNNQKQLSGLLKILTE